MGLLDFLFGNCKKQKGVQPNKQKASIIVFSADWCRPSKMFKKELDEISVNYILIDADKNEDIAEKFNITAIPTTILLDNNENEIRRWVGYDDEDPGQTKLVKIIEQYDLVEPQDLIKELNTDNEIKPFVFISNHHQRYEHGRPVMGLQEHTRTVQLEKNTNGCKGYRLESGRGYIVKVWNDDLQKPNMSDKPMDVIEQQMDKLVLRGFPIEAQSPFGWMEMDYQDYGFIVFYKDGKVEKCQLHMYDRDTYIEYLK